MRKLLPETIPGLEIERMELPPRAAMGGVPHKPGTREYLTCERGQIELSAGGESFTLDPGDVVVFRGDQRHGYRNTADGDDDRVQRHRVRARRQLTAPGGRTLK